MFQLQEISRLLVEGKIKEALQAFRTWADTHLPERTIDIDLQLSRVSLVEQHHTQGIMSFADYQTTLLQINKNILTLLEQCKQDIERAGGSAGALAALHEYHSYTCDRIDHSDSFRQAFGQSDKRIQFFYLFGGDMQSHEGFFRRIAYDLEGRLQDYLNPDLEASCQALQLEMTFEFSRQLELYQQNILRSFFSMMGLNANEHEPLLQKDINYVLDRSPRIQGLRAEDFVCIYLHISQYDWEANITPDAARWFINTFCAVDLPIDKPAILVFFAIEYDEDDDQIRSEVQDTIQQSEIVSALPELSMVPQRDIGRWFERYKQIAPTTRARKDLLKATFGDQREHYMEEVEVALKKIIDQYNNQHV